MAIPRLAALPALRDCPLLFGPFRNRTTRLLVPIPGFEIKEPSRLEGHVPTWERLSKTHIEKVSARFHVSPELFF